MLTTGQTISRAPFGSLSGLRSTIAEYSKRSSARRAFSLSRSCSAFTSCCGSGMCRLLDRNPAAFHPAIAVRERLGERPPASIVHRDPHPQQMAFATRLWMILVRFPRVKQDVIVDELDVAFLEIHGEHEFRPIRDLLHLLQRCELHRGGAVVVAMA